MFVVPHCSLRERERERERASESEKCLEAEKVKETEMSEGFFFFFFFNVMGRVGLNLGFFFGLYEVQWVFS